MAILMPLSGVVDPILTGYASRHSPSRRLLKAPQTLKLGNLKQNACFYITEIDSTEAVNRVQQHQAAQSEVTSFVKEVTLQGP